MQLFLPSLRRGTTPSCISSTFGWRTDQSSLCISRSSRPLKILCRYEIMKLPSFGMAVPCGLVVRIRRSHRRGRGSIPRMGVFFFVFFSRTLWHYRIYFYLITNCKPILLIAIMILKQSLSCFSAFVVIFMKLISLWLT